jgi:putative transcriptional regulator
MGTTFDSIARGLNEAVAHAKGKKVAVKIYKPEAVDVLALRQSQGMTQAR